MLRIALCCAALLALAAAPARAGVWLAGDLHVHTTYSHDSYGGPGDDNTGPDEAYTLGQTVAEDFALAATRGLDYLAITDHNDIRSQSDPGFGLAGVLPIPAYENSLHGHGQMLGATRIYDHGDASPAAVRAMEGELHAAGGLLQANHPTDPVWDYAQQDVPVDTIEVWNLPWLYQPPFPAAGDHEGALRFWIDRLDRGFHVGATGGSDSHWKSTVAAQGPGQPTTWVYASERSVRGVLDGIRAGRTFISHEPPNLGGPRVFLEGDPDRDGIYDAMVGDTVAPGTPLRVRVSGAPGALLEVVVDGGRDAFAPVPVTGTDFTKAFTAPDGATHVHAEVYGEDAPAGREQACAVLPVADLAGQTTYCKGRIAVLAITSAMYLAAPPRP